MHVPQSTSSGAPHIDKSYAVHELARILDMPVGSMMFVGDRLDPDGNDYPAAKAGTMAIRVAGPEETLRLCTAIIDWYGTHNGHSAHLVERAAQRLGLQQRHHSVTERTIAFGVAMVFPCGEA